MLKIFERFCPIHDDYVNLSVSYIEVKTIGALPRYKAESYKCEFTHEGCSECPVFYSPDIQNIKLD